MYLITKETLFFYLFARHITKNHLFKHDQIDNMRPHKGISIYQMVRSNPKMVVTVEIKIPNLHKYFHEGCDRGDISTL